MSRLQYATDIKLIRVMCSGRVDMSFVLRAFRNGVDGVFIGGCYLGECHYITHGNFYAQNMVQLTKGVLEHVGVNPARVRFEELSSGEGTRFAELMNDFSREIRALGPLGEGEGLDPAEVREQIARLDGLVPYLKLAAREKLSQRITDRAALERLFPRDEVERLLAEVPTYYINPEKCRACMTCARRCPVDAIAGGKGLVHVIDQEVCIKCGTCFEACPPRFGAVEKAVGAPPPPDLPAEPIPIRAKKKATA